MVVMVILGFPSSRTKQSNCVSQKEREWRMEDGGRAFCK